MLLVVLCFAWMIDTPSGNFKLACWSYGKSKFFAISRQSIMWLEIAIPLIGKFLPNWYFMGSSRIMQYVFLYWYILTGVIFAVWKRLLLLYCWMNNANENICLYFSSQCAFLCDICTSICSKNYHNYRVCSEMMLFYTQNVPYIYCFIVFLGSTMLMSNVK